VTLLSSKEPYRQTDRQTHRAYKWLQVPPFNLTVNVGNDKSDQYRIDILSRYYLNTVMSTMHCWDAVGL